MKENYPLTNVQPPLGYYTFRFCAAPIGGLADAAHEGAALAAQTLGIAVPQIEWYTEAKWYEGYHIARPCWAAGFSIEGEPRIHVRKDRTRPGDVFHSASHETVHAWQGTLSGSDFSEAECEAVAKSLCKQLGNPCKQCGTSGPELDFAAMRRARAARRATAPTRAQSRPAQIVYALGSLPRDMVLHQLEMAAGAGWDVSLDDGKVISATDALAALHKHRAAKESKQAANEPKPAQPRQSTPILSPSILGPSVWA